MHWIIELCPDLRKITSNSNVQFAPPTTVQEGEKLLQKMILDASILGFNLTDFILLNSAESYCGQHFSFFMIS